MKKTAEENKLKCEHHIKVAGLSYVELNNGTHFKIRLPYEQFPSIDLWPTTQRWIHEEQGAGGYTIETLLKYISTIKNNITVKNKLKSTQYSRKFELIKDIENTYVNRLKVPGGWIVQSMHLSLGLLAMVFVPDPNDEWVLEEMEVKVNG